MRQNLLKAIAPAAVLGLSSLTLAQAQAKTYHRVVHRTIVHHPAAHHTVVKREHRQWRRIESGERNGSLTHREAERLETREARIRAAAIRDRRTGGHFSRGERNSIQHRLNNVNRAIYREKHDQEHRGNGHHYGHR